ncbi:DinB family protein [Dyadobacter flavalbus]|uniref:DinB family protein n=1 Tax=Dyadobacter flavalbus TaxID=2579942 RepID=A0A5M8Q6C2_9BACT|nr:DinB family protein [Dyadobacter flavalbus]KAA6431427.1 DinB family protein [Dyadobacter flavalbus]
MENDQQQKLISELVFLIEKGNAHVSMEDAVSGLPANMRTIIPENLPYSIWQLIEHIRIAQKDILDFCVSEDHEKLAWPDDYWTEPVENINDKTWENALNEIKQDRQRFLDLLHDEQTDLFSPIEWGDGQTILREAMLIADHNAYHTAEIVVIRRMLGCWR